MGSGPHRALFGYAHEQYTTFNQHPNYGRYLWTTPILKTFSFLKNEESDSKSQIMTAKASWDKSKYSNAHCSHITNNNSHTSFLFLSIYIAHTVMLINDDSKLRLGKIKCWSNRYVDYKTNTIPLCIQQLSWVRLYYIPFSRHFFHSSSTFW